MAGWEEVLTFESLTGSSQKGACMTGLPCGPGGDPVSSDLTLGDETLTVLALIGMSSLLDGDAPPAVPPPPLPPPSPGLLLLPPLCFLFA
ncbi:hypothetical protein LSTR_LSTR014866 [Laodelphax striatellus]|uniref:Uncharacterized protein n=1 Tax=Laodelphax striatellus TaxID=195883 RepID=A0A482WEH0_LAOST|nr:hypothetical protein LSTR_LSTR014866 [Laodelphax striatellus]